MVPRGNVFDRLGRNRERPYLSPAAARKSVFDRLRGAGHAQDLAQMLSLFVTLGSFFIVERWQSC